jgi:hypothetical protein
MFYAMLPRLSDDLSRAEAIMRPNMWPYGINSNRKELEAMLRWSFEQGLAPRQGPSRNCSRRVSRKPGGTPVIPREKAARWFRSPRGACR